VTDGESEGGNCDEVIYIVNQEETKQNKVDGAKKGADATGKVVHTCI